MRNLVIKSSIVLLLGVGSLFGADAECKIMTSPLDMKTMRLGYTNWQTQVTPIVNTTTFKYKSFVDAYSEFDASVSKSIKKTVCKKNGWSGVANYKIEWQQTDKTYIFVATYDAYADK